MNRLVFTKEDLKIILEKLTQDGIPDYAILFFDDKPRNFEAMYKDEDKKMNNARAIELISSCHKKEIVTKNDVIVCTECNMECSGIMKK